MRIKNGLAVLAGAVALACSGAASAQTSGGPNGTIFINVVDTTSGTSFLFDTGLLVSSFTGLTGYSVNLASNSASSSDIAAITSATWVKALITVPRYWASAWRTAASAACLLARSVPPWKSGVS